MVGKSKSVLKREAVQKEPTVQAAVEVGIEIRSMILEMQVGGQAVVFLPPGVSVDDVVDVRRHQATSVEVLFWVT